MAGLQGYRGNTLELLKKSGVSIGDLVEVKTTRMTVQGSLMPRYEHADEQHIVLKLKNGYNIGLQVNDILEIRWIAKSTSPAFKSPEAPKLDPQLPKVAILGTGGTIASRVDYRTGGVHPQFSAEELYLVVPEIAKYAQIHTELLFNVYSEHINADHWEKIAEKTAEMIRDSYDGIVIAHGTDTMGYSAAALSFALADTPIPIVLVGSQRSTDRPSSDAALNLIGAVTTAAKAPFSGVYVSMHHTIDDEAVALHIGARIRKNHTSRRDAFESIDTSPAAYVRNGELEVIHKDLPTKDKPQQSFKARYRFEKKVALVKFYPSFDPKIIDYLVDSGYRGIILEGTGLGHVSEQCYDSIAWATERGILVGMTSQCIWGRVRLTVYDTGRDLLRRGVIPLDDMFPETALVKMMWALGNTKTAEEAKTLMLQNIAGEFIARSPIERRPRD
ncbi:MAG: Glu-tRNA(Gln) amidotransferase subunit GatD [Thaumarchaeota archaeon]|nr:Glu-tRNA(Gln) amidotransferase subunit GatD [Nitrososphaerota archaeon]